MITRARKQKDGSWILNGAKMWITNGSTAHAAIVWAKTEDGDEEGTSIRGFIVPTDTKGFKAKDQKGKLSLRASDTSELVCRDVHLPADAILPKSGGLKSPLPHTGAVWDLLGCAGRGHRLLRGGAQLFQGARDVRPAHRRLPDPAGAPRRDGHRDREGLAPLAAPWVA